MCQLPKFWTVFCETAERSDLLENPDYSDLAARRANKEALQADLDAFFSTRPTRDWVALLGGKVPIAPVHSVAEALTAPTAQHMIETVDHPDRPDGLKLLREPIMVNGERPCGVRAPKLGEHTREILDALGDAPADPT